MPPPPPVISFVCIRNKKNSSSYVGHDNNNKAFSSSSSYSPNNFERASQLLLYRRWERKRLFFTQRYFVFEETGPRSSLLQCPRAAAATAPTSLSKVDFQKGGTKERTFERLKFKKNVTECSVQKTVKWKIPNTAHFSGAVQSQLGKNGSLD